MATKIEIREDGLYRVQDVFEKQHISKVFPGWHVLFLDNEGMKRVGYVRKVDEELLQVHLLDEVVYRNAPGVPVNADVEIIPWSQVLEAGHGFCRPKRDVFTANRKQHREVWVIEEKSDVGFIVTKDGLRLYVEKRNDRWEVR